jgi:hypothetical protein
MAIEGQALRGNAFRRLNRHNQRNQEGKHQASDIHREFPERPV